jgi:NitT/TauT family transport system substrate-binding protein
MGGKLGAKAIGAIALAVIVAILAVANWGGTGTSAKQVTVILPFSASSEFLPVYVAINEGYYAQEGLNVTAIYTTEGSFGAIKQVAAGNAQVAYASGDSVILARSKEIPVVSVYQVDHESIWGIMTKKESGLVKPQDLQGKTIAIPGPGSPPDIVIRAMLKKTGVTAQFVSVGGELIPALLDNKADAMPSHTLFEEILDAKGVQYNVMPAREYGVNFVADTIITSQDALAKDPELVRKFVRATAKGLDYATKNQGATIAGYLEKTNPDAAKMGDFEAKFWARYVAECIKPDKYALGGFDLAQWQDTQEQMYGLGIIEKKTDMSGAFVQVA